MSSTANASSNNDPWSIASKTNEPATTKRKGIATAKKHVPDAWDDDDGEAGEEAEEVGDMDNATVWRDANTKQPMPEVILATTSSSTSAAPLPAAALQQPMRILKRPTATSAFPGSASSSALGKNGLSNLKDREAAYQAARARIFGVDASDREGVGANSEIGARNGGARENTTSSNVPNFHTARSNSSPYSSNSSTPPLSTPSSSAIRNPRGPPSSSSSIHSSTSLPNGGNDGSSTSGNATPKGFTRRGGRDKKGKGDISNPTSGSGSGSSGTKS